MLNIRIPGSNAALGAMRRIEYDQANMNPSREASVIKLKSQTFQQVARELQSWEC
jgi:hypothetical protein